MSKKVIKFPEQAETTIDVVLEEFLTEQRKRLKPATVSGYEGVVTLIKDHLNGYGHTNLSKAELSLFDRLYNAGGAEHREFCQLFGPEKIIDNIGDFLGYFIIRKVMAGADFKRTAGTVTKKLSKWLAEKGYISEEASMEGFEEGATAARDLPKAEKAAEILYRAAEDSIADTDELDDQDYMEFDHYSISRIEPGKLWIVIYEKDKRGTLGPISVPKSATSLLGEGWDISCALGKVKGKWRIIEMGNVYPL